MSAEGLSVKGSSQLSWTSGPKLKGGGSLFSGLSPLIMGGLVNDTTPVSNMSQIGNRDNENYRTKDFPDGGASLKGGTSYYLTNVLRKLHEIERNYTGAGIVVPSPLYIDPLIQ